MSTRRLGLLSMMGAIAALAPSESSGMTLSLPPGRRSRAWHKQIPADAKRNGRGDYLSPRRQRRRNVESVIGRISGRQWVRHRKALHKAGAP